MSYNDKQFSVYKGNKIVLEVFGASHADEIGVKVDGFERQKIDEKALQTFVDRRKAVSTAYSTKRFEPDRVIIKSGTENGFLTGDSFKAVIKNTVQRSADYNATVKIPRPSHADFVAWSKYGDGFDYRGGGKFSGRLTAPMCIAGGICKQLLSQKGIEISAYISRIGNVKGRSYKDAEFDASALCVLNKEFPVIDVKDGEKMTELIKRTAVAGDSVGGVIECVVTGVPVGTGEYMFDSLESVISHLVYAVPAVKGIEFGWGFDFAEATGSKANDAFYYDGETVKTKTNHNGGINGGIANGMPITFRVAVKPTPSIAIEQDTVDLVKKENVKLAVKGRHDACIVPRAVPVIEAVTAIAIYDNL